jgi:hypothetical protein
MKLLKSLLNSLRFILEGVTKNFAPNEEHYPATGVVPYSGEPHYDKSHHHK